jgi:hypothetical protein
MSELFFNSEAIHESAKMELQKNGADLDLHHHCHVNKCTNLPWSSGIVVVYARVARFFLVQHIKTGKTSTCTKWLKIYQKAAEFTKC